MFRRYLQHEMDRFNKHPLFWCIYLGLFVVFVIVTTFQIRKY